MSDASVAIRPETFRLPPPPHRDPYFGLCRATYYDLEKAGLIKLIRLCKAGRKRGTTLVPFKDVAAYIRSLQAEVSR